MRPLATRVPRAVVAEARRSLRIALPLMAAQVLMIGNGLIDTLVAGRIGSVELAAIGIGAGLVFVVTVSSIGLMAALSPTMAELRGQGRRRDVGIVFRQGIWMALVFGAIDLVLLSVALRTVHRWGLDATLVGPIGDYLAAARWSVPFAVLLLAARNVCEATGRTRPVLLVQLTALAVNLVADIGLGLGRFGLPALGIAGIGWATTVVQLVAAVALFLMLRRETFARFALYREWTRPLERPDWRRLRRLLALAAPISLGLLAESGLFAATAWQMGRFGAVPAGAHAIAITTTAAFYMLPLGLSFALTARIGTAFGRRSDASLRLRSATGLALAFALSLGNALALVLFAGPIAGLFSSDPDVVAMATALFLLAAVFQISDALQAALVGLLRGLQDTTLPMLINVFSYWGIGFGVGWWSAHRLGVGPAGLWYGLIAGLSVAALLQGLRLWWLLRRR